MKLCLAVIVACVLVGAAAFVLWRLAATRDEKAAGETAGSSGSVLELNTVKSGLVDLAKKTSLPFVQEGDDFVPTLHMAGKNGTTLFNIVHNGLDELRELASETLRQKGDEVSAYLLAYSVSGKHDGKAQRLLVMELAERGDSKGLRLGIPVDAESGSVVGDVLGFGDSPNLLSP